MSTELPKTYNPPANCLRDRVILVTGAGSGIGRAAALSCAAHGATLILLGRTVDKLEAVYDEIENVGSPTPAIYPLCLEGASEQDYQTLAESIEKEFGQLHGLLHNASLLGQRTSMCAVAYPAEDPNTLLSPEQIMPAYLYLLGPGSQGISGQSFDAQ